MGKVINVVELDGFGDIIKCLSRDGQSIIEWILGVYRGNGKTEYEYENSKDLTDTIFEQLADKFIHYVDARKYLEEQNIDQVQATINYFKDYGFDEKCVNVVNVCLVAQHELEEEVLDFIYKLGSFKTVGDLRLYFLEALLDEEDYEAYLED